MKKFALTILSVITVLLSAVGFSACNTGDANIPPQKIDGELPEFSVPHTTPYGTECDLDGFKIDGSFDESEWQSAEWSKHVLTSTNQIELENTGVNRQVTLYTTGFFSQKGVYFALKCYDSKLFWEGRMQRLSNSIINLTFGGSAYKGGRNVSARFDAVNVYPTNVILNSRVRYEGALNEDDQNSVIYYEAFISFDELKLTSVPDKMTVSATYAFKWIKVAPFETQKFSYEITRKV